MNQKLGFLGFLLLLLVNPATSVCDETVCGVGGTCATVSTCGSCGTLSGLQSFLYTTDSLCYVNCPSQSYKNTGSVQCVTCDISCNGCSGSSVNCITCASSNFRVIGSNQCTGSCGNGFYGDSNTASCTACPQGCSTCLLSSSVQCSACTSVAGTQYYLNSNACVAICPPGKFGGTSGSAPTCLSCGGSCATCSGSANSCLSCSSGSVLVYGQNSCAASCPGGQYDPGSGVCALCSSNCATCSDYSTCLTCGVSGGSQTYLHSDTHCYATCPNGYYGTTSSTNYVCSSCDSTCNGCSITSTNCIACASSNFRQIGLNSCTGNCGSGYYGDSSTSLCTVCPVGCSACSGSGTSISCTACQAVSGVNYYLSSTSCVTSCPSGQYGSSAQCTGCDSSCQTCNGGASNNCLTCPSGKYLAYNLGTCGNTCPTGSYAPASTNYCLLCNVNCKTCSSNSTNCLSCGLSVNGATLYFLSSSSTCISSCPAGKYGNNSTNECAACDSSCQTCKGPNPTDCLSCASGSLDTSTGQCISSCGSGKYSSASQCYNCPSQCSTCTSASACTACQTVLGVAYYLQSNISSCVVNCPSGSYADSSNVQCLSCTSPCASCSQSGSYCLSCVTSKYLVSGQNTCAAACPSGQYAINNTFTCALCSPNCKTCSNGNSSYCDTCGLASNGLQLFLYTDHLCYSTCPTGYYGSTSNYQCTACSNTCDGCTLSATNCINCASGNYRQIGSNACGSCATGYYGDTSTNLCTICPTGCKQCSAATTCTVCVAVAGINYYLLNSACLQVCPSGKFGDTSGSAPVCTACTAPCATCSTSATTCLTCTSGNVLRLGSTVCASTCLAGSYDGGSGYCLACSIYCKSCTTSSDNCQSCNSLGGVGYYLSSSKCIATCPTGNYPESSNLTCIACATGCATCTGSTVDDCTSCKLASSTNYFLKYGTTTCATSCPNGQYSVTSTFQCLLCSSSCLTCSGDSVTCQTCGFSTLFGVDLFLYSNQCLLYCPAGYYGKVSNHQCTACATGCATCTNSTATSCPTCANVSGTIYYKQVGANICATTCPNGQFISSSFPFLCQLCSPTCITCSTIAENCTNANCSINYFYLNNTCLATCPTGYYTDSSLRQCLACATGCKTCFGSNSNSCYSCLTLANTTSYFLTGVSTCATSCTTGFYSNSTSNLCLACVAACASCTAPATCQSCQTVNGVAYFLSSTSCLILCPTGYYGRINDYTCQGCADGCLTCFGSAASSCYNCTNAPVAAVPYFLEYGTTKCSASCPSNQYKNTTSFQCLLCSPSCLTCQTTSTNCLTCGLSTTGVALFFYNNKCLAICPTSYWGNPSTSNCDACTTGCLQCTNSGLNSCTQCSNDSSTIYYLHIGATTCGTSCPNGQFISSTIPNYCQPCSSICVTCSVSAENCTSSSCALNFYFLNNSCLANCPDNYFNNLAVRQCTQCDPGCQSCYASGLTACTKCQALANGTKYYLQIGVNTCAATCSQGQFQNTTTLKCVACSNACKTCTDSTTCQSCQSVDGLGYFLTSSSCTVSCPLGTYGQTSNYQCTNCFAGCKSCFASTQSDCSSCKNDGTNNYYLIYGTTICNLTCPDASYQNGTSFSCLLCSPLCKTCTTNSTYCTSCGLSTGGLALFLENGTCLVNCKNGFYENSTTSQCTACDSACLTCNDGTKNYCFSCGNVTSGTTTQYYLIIGTTICDTSCPLGQFISASFPNNCQICDSNCVGCFATATNCTQSDKCKANYFFNNATNSCILVCPDGTFPNTVTKYCENCTQQCALCYGSVASKCTKCQSVSTVNYFKQINKDLCTATCNTGEYGDAATLLCQPCSPACAVCTANAFNCSSCQSVNGVAYFLEGTTCIISCPVGKYGRISDFTCITCATGCASCTGPSNTDCQSCKAVSGINYYLVSSTYFCDTSCPNGQYSNSTNFQCMLCSSQCKTCVTNSRNCLSCGFPQYGFNLFLYNAQCLQTCPNGYWSNTSGNTCDACHSSCLLCTNSTQTTCTKCGNISSTIYYKYTKANTCNTSCPDGEFISASIPNYCQVCSVNCVTCYGTAENCTSSTCAANFYFLNNSCLAVCPDNYYTDVTLRQCIQCTAGCQTCFAAGLNSCTKCKALANGTLYYLQTSITTCGPTCNAGEYQNSVTLQCTACNPVCATCTSYSVCQTCQSLNGVAYYLNSNSCIVTCPSNKFGQLSNFTCLVCSAQCATCFGGTNDQCYSCNAGFFLIYGRNLCNDTCSAGTYSNSTNKLCLLCAPQCLTCVTNSSNCLTCGFSSIGSNLYFYSNQCLLNCPVSYWANLATHNCDACDSKCTSCTNSGQSSCQTCGNVTGTIYYKYIGADVCNSTCPDGQFISASIPNFCQPCSPVCITCENTSQTCTNVNCSQNYFYLNNSCLSVCPDNYFADTSLRRCIQCTAGCQSCFGSGLTSCTKCNMASTTQYYLQIGLNNCGSGCNPGQYASSLTKQCVLCNPVCATCTSQSVCQSCKSLYGVAYFLSSSSCIYACPFGQYGNLNDFTCYTCATGCLSCFAGGSLSCYNCTSANVAGTMTNFYLVYGTNNCSTGCPNGQYQNATSYSCQLCDQNCLTCVTTSTNCLSCGFSSIGASLFLYQSSCLLNCPGQFFPNASTFNCDSCFQGCAICNGFSSQNCTVCRTVNNSGTLTPYYKYVGSTTCNTACPTGQLISGRYPNTCQTCDPGCSACFGVSTNCSVGACNSGYYYFAVNSSCLMSCPNNYYANTTTSYCTQCTAGCALCYGTGITFCTKCQIAATVPYFKVIDIDICNTTCPPGQYPYQLLLACQRCDPSCLTCNTSAIDCQTCTNVSGIPYFNLLNQCLLNCPNGYYGKLSNNTCMLCVTGCALCFAGNNVSCTQCQTVSSVVYYLVYGSTNCSLSCPPGQYKVDYLNACNLCDVNCYTCDVASNNCTSCFLTSSGIRLFLQNHLCVQSCKTGSYQNSTDNTCYPCNIGCQVCTGPSLNECQACRDSVDPNNASNTLSYYLNIGNTICSLQCPIGQFIRAGYPNICQPCAVQCIGCSVSSTNCTQGYLCTIGYYFYRATNSCLTACPAGYYANGTTRYCEVCPGGCSLCKAGNLNNCQQCKQDNSSGINYYKEIYMESCVTDCLNGQYSVASDFSCQPCHASCVLCVGTSTYCQQCKNVSGVNYFYYSNGCLLNCLNGYYGQKTNNTCVVCNLACPLCFGPATNQCYSCQPVATTPPTYYYLSYGTTYCVTVCPYGQFAVNGSFTCQYCNINCATCSGTSTNCLTCTYINTINIVYLHQNKCVVTCPGGYWHNSTAPLDHQCSPCHSYCTLCFGPSNTQCTACSNQTSPLVIYYKDRQSTTCNPTCPVGQYIDAIIPNLCVPCDQKCMSCANSSTNCFKCSLGFFLYVPTNTCTAKCPPNYFNDPTVTSNNYYCTKCNPGCLTCDGPTLNRCQTCQNVTTVNGNSVSYFKDVIGPYCVTVCSLGYYGNVINNNCDPCQTGCVSCQYSKSFCYSCKSEAGNDYFKPVDSNSCVIICPNGYYGNSSEYKCRDCIYFSMGGSCVLKCPTGYFPQKNNSKTICQDCNDPSAVGNPCNRSYTFTVATSVVEVDGEKRLQNKIFLPKGLSKDVTAQKLKTNLSVCIRQPSRRRLQEVSFAIVQEEHQLKQIYEIDEMVEIEIVSKRMLEVSTPLTVKNLRISDDRTVIYITTNYESADFSVANVVIDFPANSLVSQDGLLFQSTTASFPLSDPTFQQSVFAVFSKNLTLGAQGMIFILLSILLLVFQLIIVNRKGYHEMVSFIMLLQVLGICRIREFPINFDIYSVLVGYSYFELPFMPNIFSSIFPAGYQQSALNPVAFALGSHNAIQNLGGIIQIFLILQLCLFVYFVCRRQKPEHLARMKLYQQTLVIFFMVIVVYDAVLAVISLSLNSLTSLTGTFLGSIALAILLLIFYFVYIIVWVRPYRLFELYKINNIFRVIGLGLLPINYYAGLILIDLADLVFIVIDIVLYRGQKLNFKAYLFQRILILITLNTSIFATTSLSLLAVAGACVFLVFIVKIYYTVITLKDYIDQRRQQGASEIDVSDVVNASLKAKEQIISSNFESKLNQSDNFIYNQSLDIQKYEQMPSRNQLLGMSPKDSIREESQEQEKKVDEEPVKEESEESHQEMIVYLDPDDYKQEARRKQQRRLATHQARPATNQNDRRTRRNMRTDAMRTGTGFYPIEKLPNKREIIEEQVEVIQVQPRDESEQNSDIVSQSSDGAGWLAQNDQRNIARAKNNKLVWKILQQDSPTKKTFKKQ